MCSKGKAPRPSIKSILPHLSGIMGGSCNERTPPLRVVLGAFGDSSKPDPTSSSLSATATAGESPAAYILGTSYFANPRLGVIGNRRSVLKLNKDGRVPMEDRKGPFDHFSPKSLVLSVSLYRRLTLG